MPKHIYVHLYDADLSLEARQANTHISAIKRYAEGVSLIRAGDPELIAAEGVLDDIRDLERVIAAAKAALQRVG